MPGDRFLFARLMDMAVELDQLGGRLGGVRPRCQALPSRVLGLIGGSAGREDTEMVSALHLAGDQARDAADAARRAADELRQLAARVKP
jgi:hypothetical protein